MGAFNGTRPEHLFVVCKVPPMLCRRHVSPALYVSKYLTWREKSNWILVYNQHIKGMALFLLHIEFVSARNLENTLQTRKNNQEKENLMKRSLAATSFVLAVALSSISTFAQACGGLPLGWDSNKTIYGTPSTPGSYAYEHGFMFNFADLVLNNTHPRPGSGEAMTCDLQSFGVLKADENGFYTLTTGIKPTRTYLPFGRVFFDLENSFVYYGEEVDRLGVFTGGESESLAQILAQGAATYELLDEKGSFTFYWLPDREITGISLAYSLIPVPEPETWAMLMAGLGIMGMVTRRRRTEAAA